MEALRRGSWSLNMQHARGVIGRWGRTEERCWDVTASSSLSRTLYCCVSPLLNSHPRGRRMEPRGSVRTFVPPVTHCGECDHGVVGFNVEVMQNDCTDPALKVLAGVSTALCPLTQAPQCLSHCSSAEKRQHDLGNSRKRKHLIKCLPTVSDA